MRREKSLYVCVLNFSKVKMNIFRSVKEKKFPSGAAPLCGIIEMEIVDLKAVCWGYSTYSVGVGGKFRGALKKLVK